MPEHVKTNEFGRRIGESHPRAVLSDHELDLLFGLLAERTALIARVRAAGGDHGQVRAAMIASGLSLTKLAEKFEVGTRYIAKIARGERRCQHERVGALTPRALERV